MKVGADGCCSEAAVARSFRHLKITSRWGRLATRAPESPASPVGAGGCTCLAPGALVERLATGVPARPPARLYK